MTAEVYSDIDVHGEEGSHEQLLELGTIGWDDAGDIFDLGTAGGPTYARVTMFKGHDITKPRPADRFSGTQILARVTSNVMNLPPRGTEVLVAFPGGMSTDLGAAIIVGAISRVATTSTYGNAKEGEMIIHPDNADSNQRIMFKKTGSISIVTVASGGSTMAIILNAEDGSAQVITPGSVINAGSDGITMISGASGMKLGNDGTVVVNCTKLIVNASSQVALNSATNLIGVGATVTPANSAIKGPSGIAGTASTQVYFGL